MSSQKPQGPFPGLYLSWQSGPSSLTPKARDLSAASEHGIGMKGWWLAGYLGSSPLMRFGSRLVRPETAACFERRGGRANGCLGGGGV